MSKLSHRRRIALAMVPVTAGAMALAGGALAAPGADCVPPGSVQGYGESPVELPVCAPNLELTKTGPAQVSPGTVTWKITVFHAGYPGASDPKAPTGGIPMSAIQVDDDTLGIEDVAPDFIPDGGMLLPGHAVTYTVSKRLTSGICDQKTVSNTAHVWLRGIEEATTEDNRDTAVSTVRCLTDVAIEKVADRSSAAPGESVNWTITVRNTGNVSLPVERIAVVDPSVSDLAMDEYGADYLDPGDSLTYRATSTVPGETCSFENTASVRLLASDKGNVDDENGTNDVSTAAVAVNGPGCVTVPETPVTPVPTPAGTPAPVVCPRYAMGVSMSTAKRPMAGQRTGVVLRVRVLGNSTATGVRLRYRMPSGHSLVSTPAGATMRNGLLTMNLGTMAPRSSRTVAMRVNVLRSAKGPRRHAVTVTATCASTAKAALVAGVRPLAAAVQPAVTG